MEKSQKDNKKEPSQNRGSKGGYVCCVLHRLTVTMLFLEHTTGNIRKKHVNPSQNRAPVEGHFNLGGGGGSLGWGVGGDERDQGEGARRAQKRGER